MANPDIDSRFDHHPPKDAETVKRHETARANCKAAALALDEALPPSREKSLALTKLEEALFWWNAAIAREGN